MHFNPNHAAQEGSGIYGLPFSPEESRVVLFPVPWEAAACKESGTAGAPREIFKASYLIDLLS